MKKFILLFALLLPTLTWGQHLNFDDLTKLYEKDFTSIKQMLGPKWTANSQEIKGAKYSMFMYDYNKAQDKFDEGVRKIENGYMVELNYLLRHPDYYNVLLAKATRDLKYIATSEDMQVFSYGSYQIGFAVKVINSQKVHMVTVAKI